MGWPKYFEDDNDARDENKTNYVEKQTKRQNLSTSGNNVKQTNIATSAEQSFNKRPAAAKDATHKYHDNRLILDTNCIRVYVSNDMVYIAVKSGLSNDKTNKLVQGGWTKTYHNDAKIKLKWHAKQTRNNELFALRIAYEHTMLYYKKDIYSQD